MLFENREKRKQISKWLIRLFTACILIYLSVGHLSVIGSAISWIVHIIFPLLLGCVFAMVLNVPMRPLEQHLFRGKKKYKKFRRSLAIVLSVALVLGIFVGVAFLVIPELANAVKIVIASISNGMDQLAIMDENIELSDVPFGEELVQIDIDWMKLKVSLQQWGKNISTQFMDGVLGAVGSAASSVVDFFVALAFGIYILANKEKLKRQTLRLIGVWIPETIGKKAIHVFVVCGETCRCFVTGQATEAIILGSLCALGMVILRLPYAPTIGCLVGVTAMIPIVGAYLGAIVGAFMILAVNPFKALMFLIFLVVLQQLEGNLIYPRVVGSKIKLPSMWVLVAITIGGNIAGPAGMLLGVPTFATGYILLREATEEREKKNKANSVRK